MKESPKYYSTRMKNQKRRRELKGLFFMDFPPTFMMSCGHFNNSIKMNAINPKHNIC